MPPPLPRCQDTISGQLQINTNWILSDFHINYRRANQVITNYKINLQERGVDASSISLYTIGYAYIATDKTDPMYEHASNLLEELHKTIQPNDGGAVEKKYRETCKKYRDKLDDPTTDPSEKKNIEDALKVTKDDFISFLKIQQRYWKVQTKRRAVSWRLLRDKEFEIEEEYEREEAQRYDELQYFWKLEPKKQQSYLEKLKLLEEKYAVTPPTPPLFSLQKKRVQRGWCLLC